MITTRRTVLAGTAATTAGLLLGGRARAANEKQIVIGMQCDRTGPTQIVGNILCPGSDHYVALINRNGGVGGYKIFMPETDTQYAVPPAIEEYERDKGRGAIAIALFGTPQTEALAPRLDKDQIPGTCPGFGPASASNGVHFPYVFPIAANYWSQAAAGLDFIKGKLGGSLHGKKIGYMFYDNPAGREPLPVIHKLQAMEGFTLKEYGVPPPGIEVSAQALDIAERFRPDFLLMHVFGRATSVALKALRGVGYPLDKALGLVWAGSYADIKAAGGWGVCQGYHTMQFAGVGDDYPVLQQIREMFKAENKPVPPMIEDSVYYNRGVLGGAVIIEAIRLALAANGGKQPTGAEVKRGFESIKNFSLGGLVPPLHITTSDHEGGGWVQIYQVTGNKMVKMTPWFHGYRGLIEQMIAASA
ncbi:MAG: ABC transporter substrate-binding protein [Acetobacteraceae bacterium]